MALVADPEGGISPELLARRARRVVAVLLACAVALVATHRGEFWPFSTFAMFAGAGRPWQRALVRVMSPDSLATALPAGYTPEHLPGAPLPLGAHAIPQNDLSSLVQRAERWQSEDVDALSRLFGKLPCQAPLLVLRVRGTLEEGRVREWAVPAAALGCDGGAVRVEPLLARAAQ